MDGNTSLRSRVQSARDWSLRVGLSRKLAWALAFAVIASGIATYTALTRSGPLGGPNPATIFKLLILDLVLVLLLAALVARRIVGIWAERRRGGAGSRLHVRFVVMFSLVAVTPAILVAVFSALLIEYGVQQWFNARVSTALKESLAVATAYLAEHQQVIGGDALAMANDMGRDGFPLLENPLRLNQVLAGQAAIRGLAEAVIFTSDGRVVAHSGLAYSMELSIDQIPRWAYDRAKGGDVAILTSQGDERVRALVVLPNSVEPVFLYVGRFVDPRVLAHMERTHLAVAEYERLEDARSGLEMTFSVIYAVVALLLLLAAVWIGFAVASQLATPITRLIEAAERVRGGDLSARVVETGAKDDELGLLSRAFNRMTSQLDTQRRELIDANRELDERRLFTEAVLAGVSAGVIGLDNDGRIELPNRSASDLLDIPVGDMVGRKLADIVPEAKKLIEQALRQPERPAQDEISVRRNGRSRVLLVRIVAEEKGADISGFVVTFDDVTELLSAQRQAAWADVARRIAHEIKNPLTPIQLSAERLKRKYLKEITSDPGTFLSCTDTIIRQVGDIGRMVDEFSAFARMPAPTMKEEDILTPVRQAVFLAANGYPNVEFVTDLGKRSVRVPCDVRQIEQALTNLLKNAVESIEGREGTDLPRGRVEVNVLRERGNVVIAVTDNGKGLPHELRDRLTEPYVTTRAKGTGLGLAIVKKIMEDHGGELILDDVEGQGARASLVLRKQTGAHDAQATAVIVDGA
jgi:two-component system nitrogen regulation sensor histidine kinase NtrY